MPPVRNLTPGYVVIFPNRNKAASRAVQLIVTALLIVSVVLILAVTIGGWSKLEGLKPLSVVWCISYLLIAVWVMRWSRGLLPIAAALALMMLMVAVIAGLGLTGASWFDRNNGFDGHAMTVFGGSGLGASTLGALTVLIAPVQILLIFFCASGMAQGWNVEMEVPKEQAKGMRRGSVLEHAH